MSKGELQAADVEQVASSVLERPVSVERHPVGFGNENWIVRGTAGEEQWILKVGPLANAAKWRSAHEALALARSAGVPVPELIQRRHPRRTPHTDLQTWDAYLLARLGDVEVRCHGTRHRLGQLLTAE